MMRFSKDNLKCFVQKGKVAFGASAVAVTTALMSAPAFAASVFFNQSVPLRLIPG